MTSTSPLTLPPRQNVPSSPPSKSSISTSTSSLTPLETLLQLGFSRQRAERALVATGNRGGAQLASDWLLAHVKDPTLDVQNGRTFNLYLCPSEGPLRDQLQTFWDASRTQVGWNGAHNSFPHMTLTSPFQCPDSDVPRLLQTVQKVTKDFCQDFQSDVLKLEKYYSPNFLGLFVGKREEILLRSFSQELLQALAAMGIKSDPLPDKSYHLTLAYQFLPQHFNALEDLAEASINQLASCHWELRLYSCEARLRNHDVFKVLYAHIPRQSDELELMMDDFVYISPEDFKNSSDGWVSGTSWLTGCSGFLPKNYLQQTAETNAWTLHMCLCVTKDQDFAVNPVTPADVRKSSSLLTSAASSCSSSLERLKGSNLSINQSPEANNDAIESKRVSSRSGLNLSTSPQPISKKSPRRVYICRHGERVDFTFGTWIPYCFDDKGNYSQKDLNMPLTVPKRKAGAEGFLRDCPLTTIGLTQAKLVGEAMKAAGINISHAFVSPSLRCVQTCHGILQAMNLERAIKMNMEPGLFEWLGWYQNTMPDFMTPDEMSKAGYNIEVSYKPYISAEELQDTQESCEQYYTRNFFVTQCILQATEEYGGDVLLVAHAATLDTCTRQITGESSRPLAEMMNIVRKIPYCSMSAIEEVRNDVIESGGGSVKRGSRLAGAQNVTWRKITPPVAPLTHSSNARYEWKVLNSEAQISHSKK